MKLIICLTLAVSLGVTSCAQRKESGNEPQSKLVVSKAAGHRNNPYYSRTDTTTLNVSDAEWKRVLPDSVFEIARHAETEYAFTGMYWDYDGVGTYYCAACGNKLFRSDAKFASQCGWPSFFEPSRKNSVTYKRDTSYGMIREEVLCGRCGGHLGHVFDDGPPPTGKRFCMNSIMLDFEPSLKK